MNISHIEVIIAVAKTGSLTKAAEQLGYTQPGISNIIRKAEHEFSFPLFNREHTGVHLTSAAEKLMPYFNNVMESTLELRQQIQNMNSSPKGSICIGTYSSISVKWLPKIIREFTTQFPEIKITIKEGGINELETALINHTIDLALISRQDYHDFEWIHLYDDDLYLVANQDYDFSDSQYSIKLLHDVPFVTYEPDLDADVNNLLNNLASKGILPDIQFRSSNDMTLLSMIEQGLAIGIIPGLIADLYSGSIKKITLYPPAFRELGIALPKDVPNSAAVNRFIELAMECIAGETIDGSF